MKKIFRLSLIITIAISVLLSQTSLVFAYNEFYSSNDILFYDEKADECTDTTPLLTFEKSDTQKQIFQLLIAGGFNAGQTSAIMGNMYRESKFNSASEEAGTNMGYGLAQWTGDRRVALEAFAKQKGVAVTDIPMQIEFLLKEYKETYKAVLDKTDFKTGTDVPKSTEAFMINFEAPFMSPENDPAALYSERIPAAEIIYGYYSSLSPISPIATTSADNCLQDNINAAGMVATAINLALKTPATDGMIKKTDASLAYQASKDTYSPGGGDQAWTDCGRFVATVMKMSGTDANYPIVTVSAQLSYVNQNPSKYKTIKNAQYNDLKPGDIIILSGTVTVDGKTKVVGHTLIFTGQSNYPIVEASLDHRVPSVMPRYALDWALEREAIIVRPITQSTNSVATVNIDMPNLYNNSTDIDCAAGTNSVGTDTAYHDGNPVLINLCELPNTSYEGTNWGSYKTHGPIKVNSRVSGAFFSLMNDLKVALGVNKVPVYDGFRTMARQTEFWCEYTVAGGSINGSDSYDCTGYKRGTGEQAAKPGFSNHQMGLAIDFVMEGTLPKATRVGDHSYDWLIVNASRYGVKKLDTEAWHWGVTK